MVRFTRMSNRRRRGPRRVLVKARGPMRLSHRPMTTGRVKRIIGAELKKFDLAVGPVNMPTITGLISSVSFPAQGDTNVERTGNWITPVNIHGTFIVQGNAAQAAATSYSAFRIGIMVWNNDFSVDVPTVGKIASDSSAPLCPFSLDDRGSFRVIWSRTGAVANDVGNAKFHQVFRFYVRLSGAQKVLFDGAAQKKYQLIAFGWSDVAAAASEPQVEFCTSFRFTDS